MHANHFKHQEERKKIRGNVTILDNQGVSTSRKVMRLAKEEPGKVGFYYVFILVS